MINNLANIDRALSCEAFSSYEKLVVVFVQDCHKLPCTALHLIHDRVHTSIHAIDHSTVRPLGVSVRPAARIVRIMK